MKNSVEKFLILILSLSLGSSIVLGTQKNIAVYKSKNSEPYNLVLQGFKNILNKKRVDFNLTDHALEEKPNNPDLILTIGWRATDNVIKKAKNIPIVYSMVVDPQKSGFVGNNITGVSMELSPTPYFTILKELLPKVKKIGVLYNPKETQTLINEGSIKAKELGLELVLQKTDSAEDVYSAIRSIGMRVDAIWMVPDPTIFTAGTTEDVILYGLRTKVLVIGLSDSYTKAGALFSLSYDYEEIGQQAGEIAVQIFDGTPSDTIPVKSAQNSFLSLNLTTADRIGISVPSAVKNKAKDVYK